MTQSRLKPTSYQIWSKTAELLIYRKTYLRNVGVWMSLNLWVFVGRYNGKRYGCWGQTSCHLGVVCLGCIMAYCTVRLNGSTTMTQSTILLINHIIENSNQNIYLDYLCVLLLHPISKQYCLWWGINIVDVAILMVRSLTLTLKCSDIIDTQDNPLSHTNS